MTASDQTPLIIRSRVTPWGYLVALTMAIAFASIGLQAFQAALLPAKFGVFVEPPPWLLGALLLAFALFLFLIGIAEFARYVKPSVEVVVDRDGISTFGVMGERRFGWQDIVATEIGQGLLSLHVRGRGRMRPPDVRIYFNRLDLDPSLLMAQIRSYRPDLDPRIA